MLNDANSANLCRCSKKLLLKLIATFSVTQFYDAVFQCLFHDIVHKYFNPWILYHNCR